MYYYVIVADDEYYIDYHGRKAKDLENAEKFFSYQRAKDRIEVLKIISETFYYNLTIKKIDI